MTNTDLAVATPRRKATERPVSPTEAKVTGNRGQTYNSTNAGLPLPISASQLAGVSSRTLDAHAPPSDMSVAKTPKDILIFARRERKNN